MTVKSESVRVPTLDEWTAAHAESLARDIEIHIECVDDAEGLHRMVMTSVRQWAEEREKRSRDIEVMLNRLINKCNVVTAEWRHTGTMTDGALSELYERQVQAERLTGRLK